jgi:hypothetical protein
MKADLHNLGRAFAPGIMARALRTFDRAMVFVVMTCWGVALLVMAGALYTLNISVVAKREALEAAAQEPSLPRIVSKAPDLMELQPLIERMKKRFPEISFSLPKGDHTLTVMASSANNFRLWLTVLSYIDTISPQYRWSLKEFCVGSKCDKSNPMKAVLTAEKIAFTAPDTGK